MNIAQIRNELEPEFWKSLQELDEQEANKVQKNGCPHCNGNLHKADYPRKPRGIAGTSRYERRHSFCCEHCRKRTTPKSVRFLGRKVYAGIVIVIASYLREGQERVAIKKLVGLFGVSEVTVRRWLNWWRESVVTSSFWKSVRGMFIPAIVEEHLVSALYERLSTGITCESLKKLLSVLSPLTVPADYPC